MSRFIPVALAGFRTTQSIDEMNKAIENKQTMDSWTLNLLYYLKIFLPKPFNDALDSYLTKAYSIFCDEESESDDSSLDNISQSGPLLVSLIGPDISRNPLY